MVPSEVCWPKTVGLIRSISIQVVAAVFASAFLTSVAIALFETVDTCKTLTATELCRTSFLVSVIPPTLTYLLMAFRMRQSLDELRMTHKELVNLACIDAVTGLLNRKGFDAVAAEAFAEADRLGRPISALMCDIDTFGGPNRRHGYEAGDIVLKSVTEMIQEGIGDRNAIFCRQGGDEFVILLPDIELEKAARIAEDLREVCEARALVQENRAAKFTISIGVGTKTSGASELRAVLRPADAALYRAKRAGGNQVVPAPKPFVQRTSLRNVPVPDGLDGIVPPRWA